MNYFVEGLQGSGKTTLTEKLLKRHPDHVLLKEGDYSPLELAWCALVDEKSYPEILSRYPELAEQIKEKSFKEDDHYVICYTKVKTDDRSFYRDLEQYEIYNGRISDSQFRKIVLSRYSRFNDDRMIFECSLFQNIVEDMILFKNRSDEEIIDFYKEVKESLSGKEYLILYLYSDDIEENFETIRKQRIDDKGNEIWYQIMLEYFNNSPYALMNNSFGEEELIRHFKHRQDLELKIMEEVFPDKYKILRSKHYSDEDLL
jgi:hypothetical protein